MTRAFKVGDHVTWNSEAGRVRGKILATIPPGDGWLHVYVDPDERQALIETQPDAYEEIVWGQRAMPNMVRVVLARADRDQVCELLEESWRRKAPKRLVAQHDADRG